MILLAPAHSRGNELRSLLRSRDACIHSMIQSVHLDYVGPKHLGAVFCRMRRLFYSNYVPHCHLLTLIFVCRIHYFGLASDDVCALVELYFPYDAFFYTI